VDKDSSNKIVDRLIAEGSLIRNTGTNSIKSVRTDLAKFGALFESINSNIIEQTQILRNSLKIQIDEEKIRKSAKELLRADRTVAEKSKEKVGPTSSAKLTSDQQAGGFLASLAGLFGGAAAGIGGSLLAALKTPLRTALFTVLAPAVGTLLGNITEEALLNMGSDPGTALKFGEAANLAGMWGMIGLAFGKRAGVIGAVAGAAASFGDEVLDAVGLDKNKMVTLFGQEMKLETVAKGIMGALGASMATAVTSPAFMTSLGSFFKNTVGPDGEVISRFARRRALIGGTIATAVLGAYIVYGDDVKNWLSEQGMPPDFATTVVDTTSYAVMGWSIGKMFGPYGAIAGTAIGFAIGLGMSIDKWLRDRADKLGNEFLNDIGTVEPIMEKLRNGETLTAEENKALEELIEQGKSAVRSAPSADVREKVMSGIVALEKATMGQMKAEDISAFGNRDLQFSSQFRQNIASVFDSQGADLSGATALKKFMGDQYDQASWFSQLFLGDRDEYIKRAMKSTISQYFVDNSDPNRPISFVDPADRGPARQQWESFVDNNYEKFSKGSTGFQDFGAGSFAVLHGREAVIPEQTPAGQFLKSYFDENWEPRLASKLNQSSSAAVAMGGTTVIINSPITNAPITSVNNGGNSSSTMVVSGVGGRADLDARSIPYGAN
jgi:hypothetical protein